MLNNSKNSNLDDLIGTSQQPIIVQEGSSDKKFLYTLLIMLVVLFIIALGLIAFLGSKYFGDSGSKPTATQVVQTQPVTKVEEPVKVEQPVKVEKPIVKEVKKPVAKPEPKEEPTISELENIVQEESKPKTKANSAVEQTINKVASKSGNKGLSPEELATIAKLVAQELAKSKAVATKPEQTHKKAQPTKEADDATLVAALQQAQTDTLKEQDITKSSIKHSNAKASSNAKKVDTFNKVIVEQKSSSNDELSQLSAEIDTILQSEDVKKEEKNLKFKKALDREANLRAKELRFIVVKRGDTLSSIAYRAYGRASAYMKIYKANPDLVKNPNRIYVGMKLRVPVDEEYKSFNSGN